MYEVKSNLLFDFEISSLLRIGGKGFGHGNVASTRRDVHEDGEGLVPREKRRPSRALGELLWRKRQESYLLDEIAGDRSQRLRISGEKRFSIALGLGPSLEGFEELHLGVDAQLFLIEHRRYRAELDLVPARLLQYLVGLRAYYLQALLQQYRFLEELRKFVSSTGFLGRQIGPEVLRALLDEIRQHVFLRAVAELAGELKRLQVDVVGVDVLEKGLEGLRLHVSDRYRIALLGHAAVEHRLEDRTGHRQKELVTFEYLLLRLLADYELAVRPLSALQKILPALGDPLLRALPVARQPHRRDLARLVVHRRFHFLPDC